MTLNRETILIAVIFVTQIVVLSVVVPGRFARGWLLFLSRYPERDYPRLYPVSQQLLTRQIVRNRPLHALIVAGGTVTLALGLVYFDNPLQLVRAMLAMFGVQVLPVLFRLPSQIRIARAFRDMPAPAVRNVQLKHWRVTDFVPPAVVALGLAGSASAIITAVLLYAERTASATLLAYSAVVNGALMLRMLYVLFGRHLWVRPDPYMSEDDVFRIRRQRMRLLFPGAAIVGAFFTFMTIYATHRIPVDIVYICLIFSALSQAFLLWGTTRLIEAMHARDVSVYRTAG